jgi:hypothetical protein
VDEKFQRYFLLALGNMPAFFFLLFFIKNDTVMFGWGKGSTIYLLGPHGPVSFGKRLENDPLMRVRRRGQRK